MFALSPRTWKWMKRSGKKQGFEKTLGQLLSYGKLQTITKWKIIKQKREGIEFPKQSGKGWTLKQTYLS